LDFTSGNQTLDPRITFTRATTATFTGSNGLIQTAAIDAPRFDYNPTTLAPLGLLIEEQRTNSLLYSTDFSTGWNKGALATWTQNAAIAPDGTMTALGVDGITGTARITVGNGALYTVGSSITGGSAVTVSVYVRAKTGTESNVCLRISETGGNNTVGPGNTIGTAWQRISLTVTTAAGATAAAFTLGTTTGTANIFIWGAQQEVGAFATSYIPTVASQVTRSSDVAVMTGTNFSDWYNATEGTLYAEGSWVGLLTSRQAVIINNSASQSTNFISIQTNPSTATTGRGGVTVGGTAQATMNISNAYTAGVLFKAANAYQQDNFAFTVDGSTPATDTSGTLPIVNQMQLGAISATTANIWLRRIAYYPRRLANSELVALTS
jgi:hypothetical protein